MFGVKFCGSIIVGISSCYNSITAWTAGTGNQREIGKLDSALARRSIFVGSDLLISKISEVIQSNLVGKEEDDVGFLHPVFKREEQKPEQADRTWFSKSHLLKIL
jgi:hypothetical protein